MQYDTRSALRSEGHSSITRFHIAIEQDQELVKKLRDRGIPAERAELSVQAVRLARAAGPRAERVG
jgi:hypothetical protein